MAMVKRLGGSWVIIQEDEPLADDPGGNASAAARCESETRRLFWTGSDWGAQYGLALQFTSPEEADAYLARYWPHGK